jgi:hypothetical protein
MIEELALTRGTILKMALAPLHPAEPALHHELRDALNADLSNKDFFVWINVTPLGSGERFSDLGRIVRGVEAWLAALDPDAVSGAEQVPELEFIDPVAEVRVRAIPKKPTARREQSGSVVGNPEPILVGWS